MSASVSVSVFFLFAYSVCQLAAGLAALAMVGTHDLPLNDMLAENGWKIWFEKRLPLLGKFNQLPIAIGVNLFLFFFLVIRLRRKEKKKIEMLVMIRSFVLNIFNLPAHFLSEQRIFLLLVIVILTLTVALWSSQILLWKRLQVVVVVVICHFIWLFSVCNRGCNIWEISCRSFSDANRHIAAANGFA